MARYEIGYYEVDHRGTIGTDQLDAETAPDANEALRMAKEWLNHDEERELRTVQPCGNLVIMYGRRDGMAEDICATIELNSQEHVYDPV